MAKSKKTTEKAILKSLEDNLTAHRTKLEALKTEIADNNQCIEVLDKQSKKLTSINEELQAQQYDLEKLILIAEMELEARQQNMSLEDYLKKPSLPDFNFFDSPPEITAPPQADK